METYKQASKEKLRVLTSKGSLSVEQLWDLSLIELDGLAVQLEEDYNASKGKSFLSKKSTKDKDIKLQFDIVLDILETKVQDANAAQELKENKEHNQKILGIIADKNDESLKGKSIAQLEKMLK